MIFKKNFLLLPLFLIIIFQALLFTSNKQKTSFRYFKWNVEGVSIGKLITISFFSGLFISTLLNTTIIIDKKNTFQNTEENHETLDDDEDIESNVDMPPQRNIRDTQPTISVNYRVVKNTEEKKLKKDQNFSNYSDSVDDWDIENNDW